MGEHPPPESGSERYRVADLVIDVGTRRVSRGADDIPLPGLSFSLLLELIRAAPNLVSLDELMRRVWPGLVVNSETVSQRIKLLRKALGDDAHAPRYVVGVRGHGCRLAVLPERLPPDAPARSWRQRLGVPILVALLLAAVGLAAYRFADHGSEGVDPDREPSWEPTHAQSIAVLPFLSLSGGEHDELIALGISENVLHQLAQLPDLHVIARTSSFALGAANADARRIGRTLDAHYLLEGSVQKDGDNLRVLAQLIDATSGEHLWSLRFDEAMRDLFAVQDRIANAVAEALTGTADRPSRERAPPRDSTSLDAWLYYQQGSRLLSSRRHDDLNRGRQRFEAAVREDPRFAAAWVGLAESTLLASFHDASEFWFMRRVRLSEADEAVARSAIDTALELDPLNGDAYIARAWMTRDLQQAEAGFRQGLALNPSSVAGYERLARLTFFYPEPDDQRWDSAKRAESYRLIERAVQLDPLAPSVHLTQALMLLYGRSDAEGADAAIMRSLGADPNYYPALERLGELRWCCQAEPAEAVRYIEAALAVEPDAEGPRHFLVRIYLDLSDPDAAARVAEALPEANALARLPIALARGDWAGASALADASVGQVVTGLDADMLFNVRFFEAMEAIASEPSESPEQLLADWVQFGWTEQGEFWFIDNLNDCRAAVSLGGLLLRSGKTELGRQLLESALEYLHWEATTLQRGYAWYSKSWPAALAWLGRDEEALEALQQIDAAGFLHDWWYLFDVEPAFENLRADPRFVALRSEAEASALQQRKLLAAMQQRGEVPLR